MLKKFYDPQLDEVYIEGSNEEVFSGRLLKVQRDHVRLPNGNDTTREYIHHPGAVAIVPVLDDGRIVLVKQCRYPLGTLLWEIPAGKLDHGEDEDKDECARRELSEETGYEAEHWQRLLSIATTPGFSDEIIHLYKAWGLKKYAQHTDEDEFIGVQAFKPQELREMVAKGELYDAKSLCALYAAGIL
ncbi:NUDIX hydrolase [uncultured Phascolarctobacterium sp.]|uniref:NUDIX domain-containing protein n=1 Tax=uncultured Phascolarctobacterium sp. TaxID=512296 RepID=UPI0025ECC3D9|nr:NUDIX hydrolase [uncultured Phascolarctobacterium sp.]